MMTERDLKLDAFRSVACLGRMLLLSVIVCCLAQDLQASFKCATMYELREQGRRSLPDCCTSVIGSFGPDSEPAGIWHTDMCDKEAQFEFILEFIFEFISNSFLNSFLIMDRISRTRFKALKYDVPTCMAGRRRQELEAIHSPSVPESPRRDSGGAHRDVLGVAALRAVGLARAGKPAYQHLNAW